MPTLIYPSPIFGPVISRRLGISLGINLQPDDGKICTFDCLYCECGFNRNHKPIHKRPTREQVFTNLQHALHEMRQKGKVLNDICFAGNGEPTAHPEFHSIVTDTMELRDNFYPKATVSVLSNSTFIHHDNVRQALMMVDNNILKLDTVDPDYIRLLDRPTTKQYDIHRILNNMLKFNGQLSIQTMFLKGHYNGVSLDNTLDSYVQPWLNAIKKLRPKMVMIYTIDRETPVKTLLKATPKELDAIKNKVESIGLSCSVAY